MSLVKETRNGWWFAEAAAMRTSKRARRRAPPADPAAVPQVQSSSGHTNSLQLIESGEENSITGSLTDDCIVHILHSLPTRFLLSAPALVCRRWRRLCTSHLILELLPSPLYLYKTPSGSLTEEEILGLARRHASTLEKISLHGVKNLKGDQIISIVRSLPRLKQLEIISCHPLESTDLEGIANSLPGHITCLDIHSDHLLTQNCHECVHPHPPTIQDGFIQILQKQCPNLQNLVLDSCSNMSTVCLNNLLMAIPNFRSLSLHSHALGWLEVSNILQSCTSLQHLSIVSGLLTQEEDSSDDEYQMGLQGRRGKLCLRRQIPFASCSEYFNLGSLVPASLCSIRLYCSPHQSVPLDSTPLSGLLKDKGQQLRHLHAQSLYNTSWHTVSVWCANLRTLDLSHARNKVYSSTEIEEVVLSGLPRLLNSLERIGLPTVTDRILVELGRFCPKLCEIHFEGHGSELGVIQSQSRVTDRGAVALAEGCPNLQIVSLAGCIAVTIASLRALTFHCRDLKAILLPGCTGINDQAVAMFFPRFSNSLLVLDLTGCRITSTAIRHILQHVQMHGTSLVVLAISRSLWKATKGEHSALRRYIPTIRALSSSSGLSWDGFYASNAIHKNDALRYCIKR